MGLFGIRSSRGNSKKRSRGEKGEPALRGLAGSSEDLGPLCSGPQEVEDFKLGVIGLKQCPAQR